MASPFRAIPACGCANRDSDDVLNSAAQFTANNVCGYIGPEIISVTRLGDNPGTHHVWTRRHRRSHLVLRNFISQVRPRQRNYATFIYLCGVSNHLAHRHQGVRIDTFDQRNNRRIRTD